ncbi:extradiol ring-cleavage dioxygenase [Nonomuraea sp. PA05]|nr:extradiol ring-cleavage dioxygenase [Nonomuraea sp. PA05]
MPPAARARRAPADPAPSPRRTPSVPHAHDSGRRRRQASGIRAPGAGLTAAAGRPTLEGGGREERRVGQIVGAAGVPHTPHFPGIVRRGEPLGRELERLYGEVAGVLRELAPDVLVVFTSDHYNTFFVESVPIFSIGVAESAAGPSDYAELPRCEARIDAAFARRIQAELVRAEFDVGMSQEFELDHAVTVPLHFLMPGMDVPIVPVFVSGLMPPIPLSRRCHALGAAIRAVVEEDPAPTRVAVLASGSFSLEIGGPRISADSHTGVPDPRWAERVLTLLDAAEVGKLVAEASEEQLARAGNAGGELLDWIAMLGTFDPRAPVFLEAQERFGHAYAAWRMT